MNLFRKPLYNHRNRDLLLSLNSKMRHFSNRPNRLKTSNQYRTCLCKTKFNNMYEKKIIWKGSRKVYKCGVRCGDQDKCGAGWNYLLETSFTHTLQRCMVKLKEIKQGKLNNKQQNSSKANITKSASVTSSIRGLQMAPTQLGAKPSAVSVKNWDNTSQIYSN